MDLLKRLMMAIAAMLIPAAAAAQAADWPSKPIKLVVGWPPGGGADAVARAIATPMAASLRQPVVVENRSGVGGRIGAQSVARAEPDGYTLLFASDAELTIAPMITKSMPYDSERDFRPITLVSTGPFMLVAHPSFPPNTLAELVAYAKANPGKVNYGSFGVGTNGHLLGEQLNFQAGIKTVHIAYKGSAPALVDLIGGQIHYAFFSPLAVLDNIKAGRLKAIAIMAPKRIPGAPSVPTAAEAGFPNLAGGAQFGLLAPANTPAAIIERLHAEVVAALKSSEIRSTFESLHIQAVGNTPEQFGEFIRKETAKWRDLGSKIGIEPQ